MTELKSWTSVRRAGSPDGEEARQAWVAEQVVRMRLPEVRRARRLTQTALAERLEIPQGEVSRIERRTDMYLKTLRSYIEAAGGQLHLVVEFPDADPIEVELAEAVEIDQAV